MATLPQQDSTVIAMGANDSSTADLLPTTDSEVVPDRESSNGGSGADTVDAKDPPAYLEAKEPGNAAGEDDGKDRADIRGPGIIPEVKANFFSRITFWWMTSIFMKGWKQPLEQSDLWELEPRMHTEYLVERFFKAWNEDLIKNPVPVKPSKPADDEEKKELDGPKEEDKSSKQGKRAKKEKDPNAPGLRLRRVLLNVFWSEFWPIGVVKFLGDQCSTFSPLFTKYLITWAAKNFFGIAPPIAEAFGLAVGLFVLQLVGTFLTQNFFQMAAKLGIKARVTLSGAIYRKSVKLTAAARQEFNSGRVINLVSTDTNRIELFLTFCHIIWTAPIQILVILGFLVSQISWTALVGVSILVLLTPVQSVLFKSLTTIRRTLAPLTDRRVKLTTEVLNGIRVIKFFAWEESFLKKIQEIRALEIAQVLKRNMLQAFVLTIAFSVPVLSGAIAFVLFGVLNPLDASKIFSSLSWFGQLRFPLMFLPNLIAGFADFNIALQRIEALLLAPEMEDPPPVNTESPYGLNIIDGNFEWERPLELPKSLFAAGGRFAAAAAAKDKGKGKGKDNGKDAKKDETPKTATPPAENKKDGWVPSRLKNINLSVPRSSLVAVVGAVGSGKSSLLNAIIGEMRKTSGKVEVSGKIGYAPQSAWIQNGTLKNNVLFGLPYDRERYLATLQAAALGPDLKVLPDGDQTSIGERGINLSGGQKQRVNLARVVYHDAELVLMDDPLSAVDAHVGKFLFEECILGALKDRTRVLVTHQLHFLNRVDWVVVMNGGEIVEQGPYQDLMEADGEFARLIKNYGAEETEEVDEEKKRTREESAKMVKKKGIEDLGALTAATKTGKDIMQVEDRATGAVSGAVWWSYAMACGGWSFVISLTLTLLFVQFCGVGSNLWLAWWTDNKFGYAFDLRGYVAVYAVWGVGQAISVYIFGVFFGYAGTRAATSIHSKAISRIMRSPVSFFDTTPLGRIVNRFSKDQDSIDNQLADTYRIFANTIASTIATFVLISYATPYFLIPLAPVIVLYWLFQQVYRQTSRELKRLDSVSRSPLYANFGETLTGLSTIRAYRAETRFISNNDKSTDANNAPYYLLITGQRWLGIRLESLGAILVFFSAAFGILASKSLTPAVFGLSLSYALQVTMTISFMVRQFTDTEIAMNAVERLAYYGNDVPIEAAAIIEDNRPESDWPPAGEVTFTDVQMRYGPELPLVLKGVNFAIRKAEKIGIVGRTGSGKSSLMQVLFRMVELDSGSIVVDGKDIAKMGLTDLRKHLAIIPQDPVLFTGSFRTNLDPFNEYSDAELWDAVTRAGIKAKVSESTDGLEGKVSEGGENLSVGQRQLLCLARAMLKTPKVLVMDEATANVDYETDALIQAALREDFKYATVLTIAHRLNTVVDYDRVMVMDDGKVVEFDSPVNLLNDTTSRFYKMVQETGESNAEMLKNLAIEAENSSKNAGSSSGSH